MMRAAFTGSGVALITPFNEEGVDEPALRSLVGFHEEEGTDALIVCGSTGEAAAMTPGEQREAIRIVAEENGGRVPVIAGCGGSGTAEVARLAVAAREAGADALLVSAPPYNKPPQRGLIAHYRAILDEADLPLVVYNVPGRTAVNILPETVAAIAEDERVIGVKEACGDLSQVAELARLLYGRLAIWSGNDDQTVPIMSLGGSGVISVLGNAAPGAVRRMVHAYREGAVDEAAELQRSYMPLIRELFAISNPIPIKTLVGWLGFRVGPLRLPLVAMTDDERSRLIEVARAAGLEPRKADRHSPSTVPEPR